MQQALRMLAPGTVLDGLRKRLSGHSARDAGSFGRRLFGRLPQEFHPETDVFRHRIRELERECERLRTEGQRPAASEAGEDARYLKALEAALSDPDRAHNVIAYYQLRGLWTVCHREIAAFVREMARRGENKERTEMLARFRDEQDGRLRDFQDQLHWLDLEREHLASRRTELEMQLKRHRMPWHLRYRKKLRSAIAVVEDRFPPLDDRRRYVLDQIEATRDRNPPRYPGLSVQARRQVNLSAIALAQYFYLFFLDDDIGALARAAHEKSPDQVDFGTPSECESLTRQVRHRARAWKKDTERMKKVVRRTRFLGSKARYASDAETVPMLESMDVLVTAINEAGSGMQDEARRLTVNVLEFDYWDVSKTLIH